MRALLNLLYNANVCVECAWTLQCLAGNGNEDNVAKTAIENASGVVMLMDVVQMEPITESKQPMLPARCLACLYNLCIVSEPLRVLLAANATFVAVLFEMLQECTPSLGRKAAIRILAMLVTGHDLWKQSLVDLCAIERLCGVLPAVYDRVVMHGAVSCLCALVHDSPSRLEQLRQVDGVIPKLKGLLATGDKPGMSYLSMATLSRLSSQAFSQHIVGNIVGKPSSTAPPVVDNDAQCVKDVSVLVALLETTRADHVGVAPREHGASGHASHPSFPASTAAAVAGGSWAKKFLPFRRDGSASPVRQATAPAM